MVDDTTAWWMYQNGQFDSVIVPQDQWTAANSNPLLQPELDSAPKFCTYYYGFNTAKAPFDNALVRKAFIAAVDRQGVIDNATEYAQQPALTFTPPSVLGHVDGEVEGIGIPYNPTEAAQLLATAGYTNGQGLPPITLMYNTSSGHQAIAEQVQQNWTSNLSVTVALSNTDWADYLDLLSVDPPQVWRLGWCADHYDAYNFLYDSVVSISVSYGNWSNATYENLLTQAAQTANDTARGLLYKQTEEILVETDAVMLPIYYYANGFATKPNLERTFWGGGYGGRIADWHLSPQQLFLPIVLNNYATCSTVPILMGPANGSSLSTISPLYQWDAGNDPDATGLRLEVATDIAFTQRVGSLWTSSSSGVRDFRFSRNLEPATTYYWRAWLLCDDIDGAYSDIWSFTTGSNGTTLSAPTLIAPANGSTVASSPVTLQWSPVSGTSNYLVRWRSLGQGGYTYSWVDGTERDISWLDASTVYEWWTSARNEYAIGTDSTTWQFTSPATTSLIGSENVPDGFVKIIEYVDGEVHTFIEPE